MKVDASGITVEKIGAECRDSAWILPAAADGFLPPPGKFSTRTRGIQIGTSTTRRSGTTRPRDATILVSAGALVAYDQNTLLPVGVTALPGVTGAAGSFIRWGTNGFALRMNSTKIALVRTPLISGGPSADLQLSASLPPLPLGPSNAFSYTLTVSNAGPSTAQNVVLTQTLPANSSFLSATTSAGTNRVTGGGLVCLAAGDPRRQQRDRDRQSPNAQAGSPGRGRQRHQRFARSDPDQ